MARDQFPRNTGWAEGGDSPQAVRALHEALLTGEEGGREEGGARRSLSPYPGRVP